MTFLFCFFSTVALASAFSVVLLKNPVYSAFSLVVNLLCVAGFYYLQNATFLAMAQIIVYTGAIVVLLLFVLMLLNEKVESFTSRTYLFLTLAFVSSLYFLRFFLEKTQDFLSSKILVTQNGDAVALGQLIFGPRSFVFEISSLLILVGLVAIVMLARLADKGKTGGKKNVRA